MCQFEINSRRVSSSSIFYFDTVNEEINDDSVHVLDCPDCNLSCTTISNLRRHIRRWHKPTDSKPEQADSDEDKPSPVKLLTSNSTALFSPDGKPRIKVVKYAFL